MYNKKYTIHQINRKVLNRLGYLGKWQNKVILKEFLKNWYKKGKHVNNSKV